MEDAMTIKRLLISMDATGPAVVALDTAFLVAKTFSAQVLALNVPTPLALDMPSVGEGASEESLSIAFREAERAARDRQERSRGLFNDACRRLGMPVVAEDSLAGPATTWVTVAGREEDIVARRGRLADLLVMPRPTPDARPAAVEALHAALFDTGRPVLVAGSSAPLALPRTIAIAWNGSVEATRATFGAMAFLRRAERILILIGESVRTRPERADELRAYLALHGLPAEVRVFPKTAERPVPVSLLAECRDEGVDMMVMGAFSRSRWRELMLGGVTRHVLAHATLPILLAR
jgi:nucleotide-binding universal stress UspA family protein